ncbi:MAG: hypothetical protein ACR2GH_22935 [Pseudonocardia sp.]
MAISMPDWAKRFRKRRVDPFTRASRDGLDLVMSPPYDMDMSETIRTELRGEVEALVARLLPNAVDAYSGDVLDDWLDARADQIVARLDSEQEERQAVGEALIGLARQEVARRKARYDADLTRLQQAQEALEVAREQLTSKRGIGPFTPSLALADSSPIASTLGRVDTAHDWEQDDGRPAQEYSGAGTRPASTPVPEPRTGSDSADDISDYATDYVPVVNRPKEENGNGPV